MPDIYATAEAVLRHLAPRVLEILAADEAAEAEYRAARLARLAPLARALGLNEEYVSRRSRDGLREDAAQVVSARWCRSAGARGSIRSVIMTEVLAGRGPGGWVPERPLHPRATRRRPEESEIHDVDLPGAST